MTRTQINRRRHKWLSHKRQARRKTGRTLLFEPMEARVLMTADQGGASFGVATDLGVLNGTRQIADFVGSADTNDFYRVRLAQPANLRLALDGLAADADLQLLDYRGAPLGSSTLGAARSELIEQTLDAGTYVIRVYRYSGDTNYQLTMTATSTGSTVPDYAGNSLATARDLGTVSGSRSYTDFVGRSDTSDYYRFQVAGRSVLELAVSDLTADADLELLDAGGNTLTRSTQGGTAAESIRRTLDAGTYFIRVYPYGSAETNYRLTLQVQPEGPADGAGNSTSTARDLGTLRGSVTLQDFVGQADAADYYRFRVAAPSSLRLRLDNLNADVDVHLLNSNGQVVASSTNGGANAEAVDRVLAAGDYFVNVLPYGSANSNYRLELTATAVQQSPAITGLGGVTSQAAGVSDGLVNMSIGSNWNGYRVVNDQRGLYTWTIRGTNFGTASGQVRLAGQVVPVISWSNTSIVIDPSGTQMNPSQPWNWTPRSATLQVTTATALAASQNINIAPAIRSRVYGQCTWHVARRRMEMGLTPSASAYGGYTGISSSWVPRRGDQLQWNAAHTAIVESVSAPVVTGNLTTYTLTISQYNARGDNQYSTYQTTFAVRGTSVAAWPRFRDGGSSGTSYYR